MSTINDLYVGELPPGKCLLKKASVLARNMIMKCGHWLVSFLGAFSLSGGSSLDRNLGAVW